MTRPRSGPVVVPPPTDRTGSDRAGSGTTPAAPPRAGRVITIPDFGAVAALPDTLLGPARARPARRPRLVATGYGGSFRASFSGSAHYLTSAGIDDGSLDGGFTLFSTARPDRRLQLTGAAWKVQRLLHHQAPSGFKFSPQFSAHLWRRHLPALAGTDVINTFQLYSAAFFARRRALDVGAFFYLDGTLHDYLRGYAEFDVAAIDPATVEAAIAAERAGYARADGIAVMSRTVADSLQRHYDVPAGRITLVLPGANIDDSTARAVTAARAALPRTEEFVVGFVGVYPERKGLPKLAAAVAALRAEGVPVRLQVVGRCPPEIAAADGVDAVGLIDKAAEPGRFAAALAAIDLGCQLSTVEMWGIAVLEYLRCGIPVLATRVGGIPEIEAGGGILAVPADAGVDEVAQVIRGQVEDAGAHARLRSAAAARADWARWERSAAALGAMVAEQRESPDGPGGP
jgi:glycosyltransferase involved in cell wall biosynthesis